MYSKWSTGRDTWHVYNFQIQSHYIPHGTLNAAQATQNTEDSAASEGWKSRYVMATGSQASTVEDLPQTQQKIRNTETQGPLLLGPLA